ncbi:MAG: phosphonate metabolism protein/1,5-bisphosphokinase (PRPP-forming) PhnN [Pseudomonadota bacterium]
MSGSGRGCLVLVVGPSGAGKDSILEAAHHALADDARFVFVRREITRPASAGGEPHVPISRDEFRKRADGGGYALSWEAHGLGYGLPVASLAGLAHGRAAIANVSRSILDTARQRFAPVCIVNVTVPGEILARRLAARGREDADAIAGRLARAEAYTVSGPDVRNLINDGPLERAVASFLEILQAVALPKA